MRCPAVWLGLLTVLPAQDPAGPRIGLRFFGAAAQGSVAFGRPFELEVMRSWPRGAQPEAWQDEVLAPLVVEAQPARREEQGGRVVERRRFTAWAFRRGAVALQPEFGLRGAGAARATADLQTLLIDTALSADDAGAAELLPAPPLAITPVRQGLLRAAGFALGAVLLAALGLWWNRGRQLRSRSAAQTPQARLSRQLEALAEVWGEDCTDQRGGAVAATALLRELAELGVAGEVDALHRLLDDVKFAARELTAAERAGLLTGLRGLVDEVPVGPA